MKTLFAMLVLLMLASFVRANGYVLQSDGYYYNAGVAYSRSYVAGYYYYSGGCKYWQPGYYNYSAVQVVKPAANPNDWRQEIAKAARERLEHQNFLESLRFAGLDAKPGLASGYNAYGSLQIGNYGVSGSTLYGYSLSTLADLYGKDDIAALFQQAARLTENAQGLAGQANQGFNERLGQESASRARVAEIVALGQLLGQMRASKTEAKLEFKIGPDGKPELLPPPQEGDVFKRWNAQAQQCAQCHFGADKANLKAGFDISTWPGLPSEKKMEYTIKHLLTKDPAKMMPRTADNKPGTPIPEKDVLDLWLRVGNKQ